MSGMNKQKVFAYVEFLFAWVGFCFAVISISSYQWLVGGPCCRSGLFMQCQAVNGKCICNSSTESFSWHEASAVFGVLATIASGVAVVLVLVGDIFWKKQLDRFTYWKKSKLFSAILLGLAGFFLLVSGSAFSSNNSQMVSSLANRYPQSCSITLKYGYGFVFAWLSFLLVLGGCFMSLFNSRRNKVHEIIKNTDDHEMRSQTPSSDEHKKSFTGSKRESSAAPEEQNVVEEPLTGTKRESSAASEEQNVVEVSHHSESSSNSPSTA